MPVQGSFAEPIEITNLIALKFVISIVQGAKSPRARARLRKKGRESIATCLKHILLHFKTTRTRRESINSFGAKNVLWTSKTQNSKFFTKQAERATHKKTKQRTESTRVVAHVFTIF